MSSILQTVLKTTFRFSVLLAIQDEFKTSEISVGGKFVFAEQIVMMVNFN